jgi:hypothetical protein
MYGKDVGQSYFQVTIQAFLGKRELSIFLVTFTFLRVKPVADASSNNFSPSMEIKISLSCSHKQLLGPI